MDFIKPDEKEANTLRTIAGHDEIDEWLSNQVIMRLIRSIPARCGTVFCVSSFRYVFA
jgi:hypothetical protein